MGEREEGDLPPRPGWGRRCSLKREKPQVQKRYLGHPALSLCQAQGLVLAGTCRIG